MNKLESNTPGSSHGEYEELLRQNEDREHRDQFLVKLECGPRIVEFEEMIAPLLEEGLLETLSLIKTEEEAVGSEERESAKKALAPVVAKLNFLKNRTDITEDDYEKVKAKYKIISNAVGMINGGLVDHER